MLIAFLLPALQKTSISFKMKRAIGNIWKAYNKIDGDLYGRQFK